MSQRHTCPSCGHKWKTSPILGRPKTAYYEAEGRIRHVDEWAGELGVSIQTIRTWAKHPLGFERLVKLHRRAA